MGSLSSSTFGLIELCILGVLLAGVFSLYRVRRRAQRDADRGA